MARPDIVSNGANLKSTVAQIYYHQGNVHGRAQAGEYLTQVAAAVSDIEGTEVAANLLFRATDAMLTKVPIPAMEGRSMSQVIENTATREPSWAEIGQLVKLRHGEKLAWMLVGLLLAEPLFGALRWATGW